jgi:hypothetical protein
LSFCVLWPERLIEIEIEEDVVTEAMRRAAGTLGLFHALDRRQAYARLAGTYDHRRDADMEAIERAGGQEGGYRMRSPFDEQAPQPPLGERIHESMHVNAALLEWQREGFNPRRARHIATLHRDAGDAIVPQHARVGPQAAIGVDNHTHRAGPLDMACGQLWIVYRHGTNAHDNGIGQRPQTVQMGDRLGAPDGPGMSGGRGDTPIKGLPELA